MRRAATIARVEEVLPVTGSVSCFFTVETTVVVGEEAGVVVVGMVVVGAAKIPDVITLLDPTATKISLVHTMPCRRCVSGALRKDHVVPSGLVMISPDLLGATWLPISNSYEADSCQQDDNWTYTR